MCELVESSLGVVTVDVQGFPAVQDNNGALNICNDETVRMDTTRTAQRLHARKHLTRQNLLPLSAGMLTLFALFWSILLSHLFLHVTSFKQSQSVTYPVVTVLKNLFPISF